MANAVLTRSCNRSCSFCFAPNDGSAPLPLSELSRLVSELRAEGRDTVPLVGGEPTLHPEFSEALELILLSGMKVRLFTSGLLAERVVRRILSAEGESCLVVVNLNATWGPDGLDRRVESVLARLGPRACLGVTISDLSLPVSSIVAPYERYPLARSFRLGIAQPSLDGGNRAVDYRTPGLGSYITELVEALSRRGVTTQFDCGFVLCTFSTDERARLTRAGSPLRSVCGPIPDVAPGRDAWPCYPLAPRYKKPLGTRSLATIRQTFADELRGFRASGLYPECQSCEFFADRSCHGGCLARIIPTFSPIGAPG